jgi:hypothetical protein
MVSRFVEEIKKDLGRYKLHATLLQKTLAWTDECKLARFYKANQVSKQIMEDGKTGKNQKRDAIGTQSKINETIKDNSLRV